MDYWSPTPAPSHLWIWVTSGMGMSTLCSKTAAEEKQKQKSSISAFILPSPVGLLPPGQSHHTLHIPAQSTSPTQLSFSTHLQLILGKEAGAPDSSALHPVISTFCKDVSICEVWQQNASLLLQECDLQVCCSMLTGAPKPSWKRGSVCALRACLSCYINGIFQEMDVFSLVKSDFPLPDNCQSLVGGNIPGDFMTALVSLNV